MPRLALHDLDELDPLQRRYVRILLHAATTGTPPEPSPMDAGLVLCDVLAGREPREMVFPEDLDELRDGAGSRRLFYPALLLHAWAQAMDLVARSSKQRRALGQLQDAIRQHTMEATDGMAVYVDSRDWPDGTGLPPNHAAGIAADVWGTLAGYRAAPIYRDKRPEELLLGSGWPVGRAARSQLPRGPFFCQGSVANPESLGYFELVTLHALTSWRLLMWDNGTVRAVRRAARFHHREAQPDHATSQPWAIHAFLLDPETVPTADLMLLAAGVNRPEGLDAVSRILLADAAVCLMVKKR